MKISPQSQTLSPKSTHKGSQKGFALVSTILVMSMLLLLSISMLSMSSVTTRSTSNDRHQQVAQDNARLAAMLAISKLQENLGPDTRVTANVSVVDPSSPNKYWLSAYKTRPTEDLMAAKPVTGEFVVGNHEDPLYLTDLRANKPLDPFSYLVSGNADPAISLKGVKDSVVLLNTGDEETTVRVPTVAIKDSSYGYWISDNQMKGLYNRTNPYAELVDSKPDTDAEGYYGSTVAQSFNLDELEIEGTKPLAGYNAKTAEELDKGLTLETSRLLFADLKGNVKKEAFHLLTSDSASVFSDPQNGGLKRDITAFIENGNMDATTNDQGLGLESLSISDPIIAGKHHIKTSPRFGILKDWADMRFKVQGNKSNAVIEPQSSSASFHQKFNGSLNLKRRDLTNVSENYIQPVVVESSLGWDFSPYTAGGSERLRTHLYPRLILWNPYNVTLKAKRYVMLTRIPLYGSFSYRGIGSITKWSFAYKDLAGMNVQGLSTEEKSSPGFVTEEVTLAPGECKIFSPKVDNGVGVEFDPKTISNNVLSADNPPGVNNFYVNTTKVLSVAETPQNKNTAYGFSNDSNAFYAGQNAENSDQFIVLQSNAVNNATITHQSLYGTEYETIAHHVARNWGQNAYSKWYAAQNSQNAANGFITFTPMQNWAGNRLPPRLWRRGVRMLGFDESAEQNARTSIYNGKSGLLSLPLLSIANLRGGTLNHSSPHGYLMRGGGWELPYLNGFTYFRLPRDPELYVTNFPVSPIGSPDDGFPERVVLFDIPREDPGLFSMGQFQHTQFSYLPWHPTYILGSSYSTEQSDLDATALREAASGFKVTDGSRWVNGKYNGTDLVQINGIKSHDQEVLVYDISYELNHSLWDRYMLSGIPHTGSVNNRKADWDGIQNLPISNYKVRGTQQFSVPELVEEMKNSKSFLHYHAAEMLLNHGALNVNCDNKNVWKAFLLSLKDKARPNMADEAVGSGLTPFSRSIITSNAGGDSGSISDSKDEKAWTGFRALTDTEIDALAEQIVIQLRKRGPYVSISDFINRRLSKDQEVAYKGALQAAIDDAGINSNLEAGAGHTGDKATEQLSTISNLSNRADYKTVGLPGYFSQNDLLTVIAPKITVRGDTFTIRAYGDSRDLSGNIKATAFCEVVVQRQPEFVDSSDSAIEPVRIYNTSSNKWELNESSGTGEKGLSKTNIKLGRKFKMIKFRWLSPSEI